MEIVVKGRRTEVRDRFRDHVVEKLAKLEKLDGKVIAVDVEVSRERNPRQADRADRVEITVRTRGPVIRAEACASDPIAALDLACARLESRLRRAADRRRVHYGRRTPVSLAAATAQRPAESAEAAGGEPAAEPPTSAQPVRRREGGPIAMDGDGPLVVREKSHRAAPMSLDQALYEMELVGHDFFLFIDAESGRPAVVYRRRGYDYGVIRLEEEPNRRAQLAAAR